MKRPGYQIMVIDDGEPDKPVRSYRVPWYTPRALRALPIVIGLVLLAMIISTVMYWRASSRADSLAEDNRSLHNSLRKVTLLEAELEYHREFTRRIAGLVGITVPDFSDSVRALYAIEDTVPVEAVDTMSMDELAAALGSDQGSQTRVGVLVTDCPPDPNNRPRGRPIVGRISRGYEPHNANPAMRHQGIDFAAREGTPVLASADGTVEFAGEDDTYGFLIILDHGNGFKSTYGHNSVLLVETDEHVKRGDQIAFSGNTGKSTAPHLHYEIAQDGQPVDPTGFLGQ